jgi:MSHA biogenesis protein MshG
VTGTLDAESTADVARQLVALGIVATDIRLKPVDRIAANSDEPSWLEKINRQPITPDDVILFSRQMYTLQKSGVPILRAFAGLQESTANRSFAQVLGSIRSSLDQGRELSAAIVKHPDVFSPFYVAMIRVGEISGRLAEVFNRLFIHLEFEKDVRGQIRAALRYPTFVMIAVAIALVIINIFVIPVFAGVFAGFGAQLPLMTRILITTSDFMVHWWPLLGLIIGGAFFGVRAYVATPVGRYTWDSMKLRLPIAGDIVLKATLARFARSFSLASRSGIPVLQALSVVARTVDNAFIARHIENMREGIERGDSLLRCAAMTGVFTPVVLQMIAVGEETGEIDSLLEEIAGMYERETAYSIKGLSAKIEPILLAVMAGLVLVLALGVFLPMWSLSQAAMGRGG